MNTASTTPVATVPAIPVQSSEEKTSQVPEQVQPVPLQPNNEDGGDFVTPS